MIAHGHNLRTMSGLNYNKVIIGLAAVLLPFFQIRVGRVFGLDLNVALLLTFAVTLAIFSINSARSSHLAVLIVCLAYPLMFLSVRVDVIEFGRSYVQFCLLCIATFVSLNVPLKGISAYCGRWVPHLSAISAGIGVLAIVQSVSMNLFGSLALQNPFGPLSPLFNGELFHPLPRTILRTNAIYSEPSIVGWFLPLVCAVTTSLEKPGHRRSLKVILCVCGALASFSISAFVNLIVLLLVYGVGRAGNARSGLLKAVAVNLCAASLIVAFLLVPGLGERFSQEMTNPASSIFARVVFPTKLIVDSIPVHPLGYPLGHRQFAADRPYAEVWSDEIERGLIHNSFGVVGYHFGVPGLMGCALIVAYVFIGVIKGKRDAPIAVVLLLAFSQSGRLWAPEMICMVTCCILMCRGTECETRR